MQSVRAFDGLNEFRRQYVLWKRRLDGLYGEAGLDLARRRQSIASNSCDSPRLQLLSDHLRLVAFIGPESTFVEKDIVLPSTLLSIGTSYVLSAHHSERGRETFQCTFLRHIVCAAKQPC
jgi:hypothetical protein